LWRQRRWKFTSHRKRAHAGRWRSGEQRSGDNADSVIHSHADVGVPSDGAHRSFQPGDEATDGE
jgi:hypothetical protein